MGEHRDGGWGGFVVGRSEVMMDLERTVDESVETVRGLKALAEPFERASKLLVGSLRGGGKVLICGNGGSAADAMHFATELVCRFEAERRHLPALCLNASGSDLTALANDFSSEAVFARQVEAFGKEGDMLVALTTSGNSANVAEALRASRKLGMVSIGLLGRDGGACRGLATAALLVRSDSTARIQEAHKVLIHALCREVDRAFAV